MEEELELTARGALTHMVRASGLSAADVSRKIGRSSGFISRYVNVGNTPSTKLFSLIATSCGYKVELVGNGETIVVTEE